jgi:S-DNA-T family DNA segregation ATPase FtsK/SpoIIIE
LQVTHLLLRKLKSLYPMSDMNGSEKRRATKKANQARGEVRYHSDREAAGVFKQTTAIILLISALFIGISYLSFQVAGGRIFGFQLINLPTLQFGPTGLVAGSFLSAFLGWAALLPIVFILVTARRLWRNQKIVWLSKRGDFFRGSVAGVAAILSLSLLLSTFGALFNSPAIFEGSILGGELGRIISQFILRYFGFFGGLLISAVILLAALSCFSEEGLKGVAGVIRKVALGCATFLCVKLPVATFYLVSTTIRNALHRLAGYIEKGREAEGETIYSLRPQPKRRGDTFTVESEELMTLNKKREEEIAGNLHHNSQPAVVERRQYCSDANQKELKRAKKIINKEEIAQETHYTPPETALLAKGERTPGSENDQELREKSLLIEAKLRDFGVFGKVTHIHPGPVITLFEFEPAPGVKVGRIASLSDDLAMSLKANSIRIVAPIPKRGTVGIEVPNRQRDIVRLRDLLEHASFINAESSLTVPIGKDTYGDPVVVDISVMPHLLIAGTTGTGKSVSINTLLVSLLFKTAPADLGLILIDPKILELSTYEGIPHLRCPVVTVPRQAKAVLEWAVNEMNRRYRMMQRFGVRNIDSYNRLVKGEEESNPFAKKNEAQNQAAPDLIQLSEEQVLSGGTIDALPPTAMTLRNKDQEESRIIEELKPLDKIVIVIDELADLMLTVGRDIEELITRLAQKARAAGIHLIVATQRPSVDVVTGLIKANFPARISFRVATRIDSRTILDQMGADKLLGRGDMLMMLPGSNDGLKRVHGAFVSDAEVKKVVDAIKTHSPPLYDEKIIALCDKALEEDKEEQSGAGGGGVEEYDEMYDRCVELVIHKGQASTSMLQRAFRLGYNRAARIIDTMEREGLIGPIDGAKPRQVLSQASRPAAGEE